MGRGKSQLKWEDELVLRACRWYWWEVSLQRGPTQLQQTSFDKNGIRYTLARAFKKEGCPLVEDQVYYRLTKLRDRGLLVDSYRGGFRFTRQGDADIFQRIEDAQQEQQDQVARDEQLVERLQGTIDQLIPGHGLRINTTYGNRVMGYPMLQLSGPGHQLRMVINWAEAHVKALDAAALLAEEMEE